ncbi:Crp/Fnr family transcriptional regulator [Burkholderiaceae bacterium UC74_6]
MTDSKSSSSLLADELRAVQSAPWFGRLSPALQQDILGRAQVRYARHGERIFAQGEAPDSWYCVVRGSIRLSQWTHCGRSVISAFIHPGGWLGEVELVDGRPMTHDACAQGRTKLLCIAGADFHDLCGRHPELLRALLRVQCARLRIMFEQVADIQSLTLEQRLAKQLLNLERVFGVDEPRGSSIALRFAQSDLGGLVGASRQRVNGVLRQLEREGVIRLSPAGVQIVAHEQLRARASAA